MFANVNESPQLVMVLQADGSWLIPSQRTICQDSYRHELPAEIFRRYAKRLKKAHSAVLTLSQVGQANLFINNRLVWQSNPHAYELTDHLNRVPLTQSAGLTQADDWNGTQISDDCDYGDEEFEDIDD